MDNKVIADKVKFFKKCVIELSNFLKLNKKSFCENPKNVAASQTYMYGAIQTAIFLAVHTTQKFKLQNGSNYNEIFDILCKNGKLDPKNLDMYTNMLDIRNKLIFNYDEITCEYMYDIISKDLPNFSVFLKDLHKRG
ncbi:MAG: DUF86 domain-containing protein [Clostridia bacterium]|nr:DUF86 domain-containing protein [Clostridia bacterium]MDD4386760.1 DUF86 domain-containing protein [Clostridia bacterium]